MALKIGRFDDLPGEISASREGADYWRELLRRTGKKPAETGGTTVEPATARPRTPDPGAGMGMADVSGFHRGKDDALIEGALGQLGAKRGADADAGGGFDDLIAAVKELRRGGEPPEAQRRILSTLVGPVEAGKVENFNRTQAAKDDKASALRGRSREAQALIAERSAQGVLKRAASASPEEAERLRAQAQRYLDQAARHRAGQ